MLQTICFTTCTQDSAERIARTLVEERLAACVNILPQVQSVYRWEGALQTASEVAVLVKTTTRSARDAIDRICELHDYDCPCVFAWPVSAASESCAQWIQRETSAADS